LQKSNQTPPQPGPARAGHRTGQRKLIMQIGAHQFPKRLVVPPASENFIRAPLLPKLSSELIAFVRGSFTSTKEFLPGQSPIINDPQPSFTSHLLRRPRDLIKSSFIPLGPKQPKNNPPKQYPQATDLLVLPRHPMTKNPVLPGDR
jgi:hypothetical protein